jgi:hypothetical protein
VSRRPGWACRVYRAGGRGGARGRGRARRVRGFGHGGIVASAVLSRAGAIPAGLLVPLAAGTAPRRAVEPRCPCRTVARPQASRAVVPGAADLPRRIGSVP